MENKYAASDVFGFIKTKIDVHTMGMYTMANLIREWGRKGVLRFRTDYDVDKFIAWCKLQKSLGKLDIVVIDYVQQLNVRGFDSSSNENLKLQEISKRLKAFVCVYDVIFYILIFSYFIIIHTKIPQNSKTIKLIPFNVILSPFTSAF